jgi:hypothetical protein
METLQETREKTPRLKNSSPLRGDRYLLNSVQDFRAAPTWFLNQRMEKQKNTDQLFCALQRFAASLVRDQKEQTKVLPDDETDFIPQPASSRDTARHHEEALLEIVPEQVGTTQHLSIPLVRCTLNELAKKLSQVIIDLTKLEHGARVRHTPLAIDALVSAAVAHQLPLPDTRQIHNLRERASKGEFDTRARLALDEIEDTLATVNAALQSLRAASILGEPLPSQWSNLPPIHLARNLNRLGHTLLRGRIPGANL